MGTNAQVESGDYVSEHEHNEGSLFPIKLNPPLEPFLFFVMGVVASHLSDVVANRLHKWKLTPRHFTILLLVKEGPRNQQDLADAVYANRNAMTQLIDSLEEFGYVNRKVNPENRREHIISITKKGSDALASAENAVRETERSCTSAFSETERRQLSSLIRRVACAEQ